jgi:hypothetical protein
MGTLVALIGGGGALGAASAQSYYYPPFGAYDGYGGRGYDEEGWGPPRRERSGAPYAARRAIADVLEGEGYRLLGRPEFQGANIGATGVDEDGRTMRFVIDPDDGEILSAHRLSRPAARPETGDQETRPDAPHRRSAPRRVEERPSTPAARLQPPHVTAPEARVAREPAKPQPPQDAPSVAPRQTAKPATTAPRDEPPPPPAARSAPAKSAAAPAAEPLPPRATSGSGHRAIVAPSDAQKPAPSPQTSATAPKSAAPPPASPAPSAPTPPLKWLDPGAAERAGG